MSMLLRGAFLAATVVDAASALVQVEQFGMAQCPMTSTLTTDFWNDCARSLSVSRLRLRVSLSFFRLTAAASSLARRARTLH